MSNKNSIYICNKSCLETEIEKNLIILNLDSGKYIELNESASSIWKILKNNQFTESELISKIKKNSITIVIWKMKLMSF